MLISSSAVVFQSQSCVRYYYSRPVNTKTTVIEEGDVTFQQSQFATKMLSGDQFLSSRLMRVNTGMLTHRVV